MPLPNAGMTAHAWSRGNQKITPHGNARVTTDADGRCAISGLPRGEQLNLRITLLGDQYTVTEFTDVVAPTELDVEFRRHGIYSVKWPVLYGALTAPAVARLLDANGDVLEQKEIETRAENWATHAVGSWFRIYVPGLYRMEVVIAGKTYTHQADVMVGATVSATVK